MRDAEKVESVYIKQRVLSSDRLNTSSANKCRIVHINRTAFLLPLITCPAPSLKENGVPRSRLLSNWNIVTSWKSIQEWCLLLHFRSTEETLNHGKWKRELLLSDDIPLCRPEECQCNGSWAYPHPEFGGDSHRDGSSRWCGAAFGEKARGRDEENKMSLSVLKNNANNSLRAAASLSIHNQSYPLSVGRGLGKEEGTLNIL